MLSGAHMFFTLRLIPNFLVAPLLLLLVFMCIITTCFLYFATSESSQSHITIHFEQKEKSRTQKQKRPSGGRKHFKLPALEDSDEEHKSGEDRSNVPELDDAPSLPKDSSFYM
jgi:hypothetical protein